jgi:hypothetical protein
VDTSGNTDTGKAALPGAATSAELGLARGVAVDSSGNLYIDDRTNNRIRKVTASAGIISTVVGNGRRATPATEPPLPAPN